ncbi:hypothetical protein DFH94DRAFT_776794 [Russula ochroleuca]|uniref:Yeast cell wall synthesis Kre9/Knh1-like N-terminal domain-containing protein n=1 Tax=Russula ochroleuca TaxID=152965 RepID=A0A9P5JWY6_9AGAM|nr:hypothetical protein DFH94DRAFT_776794 [Russula ochroleuca]
MFSRATFSAFVLSMALVALADPVPSSPSPGQIFNAGSTCQIAWTPDTTGLWKTMNIQLMTGDNLQMVALTTVATAVDGTASPGTFSYPCPAVTPNSAIYFYQFSHNASDLLWTGRFAIADATGATTPPPNATQPDGEAIPWGKGALVDPSKAVPPPSYLPASGSTSSNSTTGGPAAVPASSATPTLVVSTSSAGANTPLVAVPSGAVTASDSGSPAAASSSAPASGSNSNGALMLGALSARAAQGGVALAVIAGAFTFMV